MKNRAFKTVLGSAAGLSRSDQKAFPRCGWGQPRSEGAFTLVELAVVIATVALLAVMCVTVMAATQTNTQAFQCKSNHKQLLLAWRMYADENSDVLVHSGNGDPIVNGRLVWLTGQLNFSGVGTPGWVNWWIGTGTAPGSPYPAGGPLWYYSGQQPALYRCPADPVVINATGTMPPGFKAGQYYPRVRSISMSQVFGRGDWQPSSKFRLYAKVMDIVIPSKTFVFVDEHPNSVNDAAFAWSDDPQRIVDFPASFHERAASFSFADGHAETHRWQGSQISPPYIPGDTQNLLAGGAQYPNTAADAADVAWVCDNNTVHQ